MGLKMSGICILHLMIILFSRVNCEEGNSTESSSTNETTTASIRGVDTDVSCSSLEFIPGGFTTISCRFWETPRHGIRFFRGRQLIGTCEINGGCTMVDDFEGKDRIKIIYLPDKDKFTYFMNVTLIEDDFSTNWTCVDNPDYNDNKRRRKPTCDIKRLPEFTTDCGGEIEVCKPGELRCLIDGTNRTQHAFVWYRGQTRFLFCYHESILVGHKCKHVENDKVLPERYTNHNGFHITINNVTADDLNEFWECYDTDLSFLDSGSCKFKEANTDGKPRPTDTCSSTSGEGVKGGTTNDNSNIIESTTEGSNTASCMGVVNHLIWIMIVIGYNVHVVQCGLYD